MSAKKFTRLARSNGRTTWQRVSSWRRTGKRRILPGDASFNALLLVLVLYTCVASAESEQWYRIDLLIFANKQANTSDETWPAVTRSYPANILQIATSNPEEIAPMNLGQLRSLARMEMDKGAVMESSRNPQTSTAEFLFDQPSEPSRAVVGLSEEDVLAGLFEEPVDPSRNDNSQIGLAGREDATFDDAISSWPELDQLLAEGGHNAAFKSIELSGLADVSRSIRRSSLYRLLYANAWVQPVVERDTALPILIQAGEQYQGVFELDGSLIISRARYLHLETDLHWTLFAPRDGSGDMILPDATQMLPASDQALLREHPQIHHYEANRDNYLPVVVYPMQQMRRMRSSTTHFLDHPAFGILIHIEEVSH